MILNDAVDRELIHINHAQKFMITNCVYEVIMGSYAYGVSNDTSDMDVYGVCIPPREYIFPHEFGYIYGFGTKPQNFETWQQHHVEDKEKNRQYDFSSYSIIKYFDLVMDNNPNMVDSLFVPHRCVTHTTHIGNMMRDNRKLFLSKKAYFKFSGYMFAQLKKLFNKNPEGKRKEMVEKYGYDVKFAYHTVRLADEGEQILQYGDLELGRNKEHMKAIRNGDVTLEDINDFISEKEKHLQKLYQESTAVPDRPDEEKIKGLLIQCLEHHYGSLDKVLKKPNRDTEILMDLERLMTKYNR